MSNLEADKGKKSLPPKKTGLGRGLGSLLGGQEGSFSKNSDGLNVIDKALKDSPSQQSEALKQGFKETSAAKSEAPAPRIPDTARIWNIGIDKLKGHPHQPRKIFDSDALRELSQSIKEQGILQPIVARKMSEGNFQIVAGERRWRAAQLAGLHEVPVILKETEDRKALELALIENIQREDLSPIEEAEAYSHLMQEYNLTQQEVADKVGKDRATVANVLRLLNLVPAVREMLSKGEISMGQAKVLLSIPDPQTQKEVAQKVRKNQLTVRQTEQLILKLKNKSEPSPNMESIDVSKSLAEGVAQELQRLLGTRVSIDYSQGKGKISIYYYSDEEFNQVTDKLRDSWQKSKI